MSRDELQVLAKATGEHTPVPRRSSGLASEYLPEENAAPIQREPPVAVPLADLHPPPANDPAELIADGYLCRGGSVLLAAPTGIGKSSLLMQFALAWAVGLECLGFVPVRPLRTVIIQAENDHRAIWKMRCGILRGLRLGPELEAQALANVRVARVDEYTGIEFHLQVVEPLLAEHRPDLLMIDPLFAYLDGSVSQQENVSPWVRHALNPLLRRYDCAVLLAHHTNKPPSGKEKPTWQAGDYAYLGSGSAELAHWARAVIAVRSIGSHDLFELHLGKGGTNVGWRDQNGGLIREKLIGHCADFIFWREPSQDELESLSRGNRPKFTVTDILEQLGQEALTVKEWEQRCDAEAGIKRATFFELKRQAVARGLVLKSIAEAGKWIKKP